MHPQHSSHGLPLPATHVARSTLSRSGTHARNAQTAFFPVCLRLPLRAQLGHTCPAHYNPAEFVADLISFDYSSVELEAESVARVQGARRLQSSWRVLSMQWWHVLARLPAGHSSVCLLACLQTAHLQLHLPRLRCADRPDAGLVDAWAARGGGAPPGRMTRTRSGMLALGNVRPGPSAGWGRCARRSPLLLQRHGRNCRAHAVRVCCCATADSRG